MNFLVKIERYLSEDAETARKNYPGTDLQSALRIQYAAECKRAVDDALERGAKVQDLLPWKVNMLTFVPERDLYELLVQFETERSREQFEQALQTIHYEIGTVTGNFTVVQDSDVVVYELLALWRHEPRHVRGSLWRRL
jgi:hypothetical protein